VIICLAHAESAVEKGIGRSVQESAGSWKNIGKVWETPLNFLYVLSVHSRLLAPAIAGDGRYGDGYWKSITNLFNRPM